MSYKGLGATGIYYVNGLNWLVGIIDSFSTWQEHLVVSGRQPLYEWSATDIQHLELTINGFSSEVMITVVSSDPDIYFTYKAALQ